jgi:hypothetical protein
VTQLTTLFPDAHLKKSNANLNRVFFYFIEQSRSHDRSERDEAKAHQEQGGGLGNSTEMYDVAG